MDYSKKLLCPVIWQILFIILCIKLPEDYFIYTNFIFYLGIIVYFIILGDFSFGELKSNIFSGGKKYWKQVGITAVAMIGAFIISVIISDLFKGIDDGTMNIARDSWIKLMLFAISTIIFPPLAEELFYRKAFISFKSRNALIVTSLIGLMLYALEHSLGILGIIEAGIVGIPLTLSYIKTKNIYVTIMAHFLVNLIGNGLTVIFTIKYLASL